VELKYRLLTQSEVADLLVELPNWETDGEFLWRTFEFDHYKAGALFASTVAWLADKLDHHPDIHLGYQKVTVKMNTHAVQGLSPYDAALAKQINDFF
jgi:4a-hydroxytetrahydrobiopterin dehydratase